MGPFNPRLRGGPAANSAVIKGGSAAPDMARIVAALHLQLARMHIRIWVEFVKSEANLADWPSMGDFSLVHALGASRLPFTLPPPRAGAETSLPETMLVFVSC